MQQFRKHLAEAQSSIKAGIFNLYFHDIKAAVDLIRSHKRIVFCSMGKPAFACAKAVYTAHSFGLDWVELDATHAFHGDLGIVREGDLIVIVSKSGGTHETNEVARELDRRGFCTLAITSENKSVLAEICDYKLIVPLESECSPFGMAPMASTTLYMIVLHALMCESIEANNCTIEQYARNHPNGEIGEKLRLTESSNKEGAVK